MKSILLILITFFTITFANSAENKPTTETVIFGMGCFWCAEAEFERLNGIISLEVGYAGGIIENPTYENHTGYVEAVKIEYNPQIISFEELQDIFWHNVDLFDENGQFCDKGPSYLAKIYFMNKEQENISLKNKDKIEKEFKQPTTVKIIPYTNFYKAEDYHQQYKSKNPLKYRFYRFNCGRDKRLEDIWHFKKD